MPRKKAATGSGSILSYFGREPGPAPAKRDRTPDRGSTVSALSPLGAPTPTPPTPHRSFTIPRDDAAGSSNAPDGGDSPRSSLPARPEPREPVSRDAEIAASDDDESDDFEPLEALLAPRAGPTTPSKRLNANVTTPDRRPGSLFSSPLTIQPRVVRHFAMDDLLKDAKRDSSTEESFKRLQARKEEDARGRERPRIGAESLRDTLMATVGDEEDRRLDKVVRAVERTEGTAARRGWFFFRADVGAPGPNRFPFPAKVVRSVYLKKKSVSGPRDLDLRLLDLSLKLKKMALPDELFLWMLDEICIEESDTRRAEMCRIIRLHPSDTIPNHITANYLEGLFTRLGATDDIRSFLGNTSSKSLETVGASEEGFYARDWRNLTAVLETLLAPSRGLGPKSMLYCVQAAMAMAVDPELFHDPEVLLLCRKLVLSVASVFPASEWDDAVSLRPSFVLSSRPSA